MCEDDSNRQRIYTALTGVGCSGVLFGDDNVTFFACIELANCSTVVVLLNTTSLTVRLRVAITNTRMASTSCTPGCTTTMSVHVITALTTRAQAPPCSNTPGVSK